MAAQDIKSRNVFLCRTGQASLGSVIVVADLIISLLELHGTATTYEFNAGFHSYNVQKP